MKPRILAHATVERLDRTPAGAVWEVQVWGGPEGTKAVHRRVYTIKGKTDDNAAQEGIRQFVAELENLAEPEEGNVIWHSPPA